MFVVFHPFPEFQTERLLLREIKEHDCSEILFLRSDPVVNNYIERAKINKTQNLRDAKEFIIKIDNGLKENQLITWGITLNKDSTIIGTICLWNISKDKKMAEVGYALNPHFHRMGIMTEALICIIEYGFNQMALEKIQAFTHKENMASMKMLQKNGFHLIRSISDVDNSNNIIFEIENNERK